MASELPSNQTDLGELDAARPAKLRAEAIHRLQVGMFGLGAIVLMVGLANVVMERAKQTEAAAVPEAASTVAPAEAPVQNKDPLADAGVVPDLPAQPANTSGPTPTSASPAAPANEDGPATPQP